MKLQQFFIISAVMVCPVLVDAQEPTRTSEGIVLNRLVSAEPEKPAIPANRFSDWDVPPADKTITVSEDQVVIGSLAVGDGSTGAMGFGFNTMVFTENNLRVHFNDNSATSGFPDNDWTIVINDKDVGGENYFGIWDATAGTMPFEVMAGAPNNTFRIHPNGNIGIGTNSADRLLHLHSVNTPTIRFEQSGGLYAQWTWDLGANQNYFFISDVTASYVRPFKIYPEAPENAFCMRSSGNIGLGSDVALEKLRVHGSIKTDSILRMAPQAGVPAAGATGDLCVDQTDGNLKYYNGTGWETISGNQYEARIASLEACIASLESQLEALERVDKVQDVSRSLSRLYQNVPNPAAGSCRIPYFVNQDIV